MNTGILLLFGFGVLGGMLGGWLFQRARAPKVVGYIVIGAVIGRGGLGIISSEQNLGLLALPTGVVWT